MHSLRVTSIPLLVPLGIAGVIPLMCGKSDAISRNISRDELIPEVDQVMGLASFLELARGPSASWYV